MPYRGGQVYNGSKGPSVHREKGGRRPLSFDRWNWREVEGDLQSIAKKGVEGLFRLVDGTGRKSKGTFSPSREEGVEGLFRLVDGTVKGRSKSIPQQEGGEGFLLSLRIDLK